MTNHLTSLPPRRSGFGGHRAGSADLPATKSRRALADELAKATADLERKRQTGRTEVDTAEAVLRKALGEVERYRTDAMATTMRWSGSLSTATDAVREVAAKLRASAPAPLAEFLLLVEAFRRSDSSPFATHADADRVAAIVAGVLAAQLEGDVDVDRDLDWAWSHLPPSVSAKMRSLATGRAA